MANTIRKAEDGSQSLTVINLTAALTLTRGDCPCLITNTGATGDLVVTLPQDAKGGEVVKAVVTAAYNIAIDPGAAGAIYASNGTTYAKQTDNKYVNGDNIGEGIELVADGNGDWIATNQQTVDEAAESFSEVEA